MMRLFISLLYISSIIASKIPQLPLQAPTQHSSVLSPGLINKIDQLRTKWGVEGISIGLAASPNSSINSNGEWALESLSFGEANVKGNKVDGDTLFAIASNSKLFTILSIGMLIENNTILPNGEKLDWSTKIKDILPEWKLMDEYASNHVDIMDLGTMRSGMPRHDYSHSIMPPVEVVKNLRNLKPSCELRQGWQYQNHHYLTFALMVERLSNFTLPEYVQQHIFNPLNMTSTTYNATEALISGHRSDAFTRMYTDIQVCREGLEQGLDKLDPKCLGESGNFGWWTDGDGLFEAGAGGIVISANDMTKWIKELLEPTIISSSLLEKVLTPYTIMVPHPKYPEYGVTSYGMGQASFTYRGEEVKFHTGELPGQSSRMNLLPNLGIGFMIVLNNDVFSSFLRETISNLILDEVLKVENEVKVDWDKLIAKNSLYLPNYQKLPKNPRPIPIDIDIEGNYHNEGYGNLILIQVRPTNNFNFNEFNIEEYLEKKPINITGPIYISKVDKIFMSYLVFTHFDGPQFNWTSIYTKDKLDKDGKKIGVIGKAEQIGTAIFNNQGIGMFTDFWGKGSEVKDLVIDEENIEENAEVWFEKK